MPATPQGPRHVATEDAAPPRRPRLDAAGRLPRFAPLLDRAITTDPVLTRDLTPQERIGLGERRHALVLRGEYRHQHHARGLRLLQALVTAVAEQRGALIHDPDTAETRGPAAFARLRARADGSGIADQIAIVPFPDATDPARLRLTTRGMRRYGSPELELDGLPRDPRLLQAGSFVLHGLASVIADAAQVDPSGLAVAIEPEVEVTRAAVERAYAGRGAALPPCAACDEPQLLRLVPRPPLPDDPRELPVLRAVPPGEAGEPASSARQAAWLQAVAAALLGPA